MSSIKKIVIVVVGVILVLCAVFVGLAVFEQRTSPVETESEPEMVTEGMSIHDIVDRKMQQGDFAAAREDLIRNEALLTEEQVVRQQERIDTLEAYHAFYEPGNTAGRTAMIDRIKTTIDNYFITATSPDVRDQDRVRAYMSIAFQYSETWSDIELLKHIARKLEISDTALTTPALQAAVFNDLFGRALAILPNQDSYLKRAWFNSRLLLTDSFAGDSETRMALIASVKEDLENSGAKSGMRYDSNSKYYNSYVGLAFADVLDFLYQEDSSGGYPEVEYAYKKALEYANQDFLGNKIVQDIIRMNYAASIYRAEAVSVDNERVAEVLGPVAENVRTFTGNPDLNYEGILVMLREIPMSQNQNNNAIYKIFQSYQTFSDIPALLNWPAGESNVPYTFKMI